MLPTDELDGSFMVKFTWGSSPLSVASMRKEIHHRLPDECIKIHPCAAGVKNSGALMLEMSGVDA